MGARAYSHVPVQPESLPVGQRVEFAHHRIPVGDHRVGVSVGGAGVPLVFFHGIGMNRHTYLRVLNRLPQLGFMVIALDAPGHGQTGAPRKWERSFDHHIDVAAEILDVLGVRRAVMVGHSMGGRTAAELAARRPDRALAAVLIGAAVGSAFDVSTSRVKSPVQTALGMAAGVADFFVDRVGLRNLDHLWHTAMVSRTGVQALLRPDLLLTAALAIANAPKSSGPLTNLANAGTPVAILHGERDMVVPLAAAVDATMLSNATLVTLPKGHHSWVLSTPWTFAEIMRQLVIEDRLGEAVRHAAIAQMTGAPSRADSRFYARSAKVLDLAPPLRYLGKAEPSHRRLYHDFTVWDADAVARHAERLSVVLGR